MLINFHFLIGNADNWGWKYWQHIVVNGKCYSRTICILTYPLLWFTVLLYYTIQYLCYGLCILELDYDIFHAFWFACQAWGHMCAFYVYLNMCVCVCVHSSMCMYPWNELWHVPCFPIACQACQYMDFCNTAPNQILMLLCSFTVLCSKWFCSTFLSRNGQNCNKQTDNCIKLITKCILILQIAIHICLHKPENVWIL